MAAGIKVLAQDGSLVYQIDSKYQNLFLKRKGVGTTVEYVFIVTGQNVSGVRMNIGFFNSRPFVALSTPTLSSVGLIQQNTDGSWDLYVSVRGEIGTQFNWYAFEALSPSETSNYGLVVWTPDGRVVFDAVKKPMRVVGTFSITSMNNGSWTGQNGRTYAVAMNPGATAQPVATNAWIMGNHAASVNGPTVVYGFMQTASITGSSVVTQVHPSYGVILDVTNY